MTRFLVTVGCAFIGSHLVDSLVADDHGVVVIDNLSTARRDNLPYGVDLVVRDVADPQFVPSAMSDMDGCFSLAAEACFSLDRGVARHP